MHDHFIPRPGVSEAEAFGLAMEYAVSRGASADTALRAASRAAEDIRHQHLVADLFESLGTPAVVQPKPIF